MANDAEKILNTLGMARRAGALIIGQDNVFSALRKHTGGLLVIAAKDCSATVMRTLNAHAGRGEARLITLKDTDRSELGRHIGIGAAQVAALPSESGFAVKILSLYDRSDANE